MKINRKLVLLAWTLALALSACASGSAAPTQAQTTHGIPLTEADVPRISAEDARAAVERGEAVIVDVRSVESFAAGHIQGAVSIPLEKFETSLDSLSFEKDQWIITYCT